ncbi:SPFH domain containing protein [Streptomyces laurentii]|uniref:SPFH domain containing protein n=1 Tax=Streptomyces laurentii TaxID=39478 RepID=A0A160P203_STRLU|nr:SPFH domain containing protein [Streptomyces laurentii]
MLGGPDQSILDSLAIWGERDEPGSGPAIPCGLTEAQQHLIQDVHQAVLKDAGIDGRGERN